MKKIKIMFVLVVALAFSFALIACINCKVGTTDTSLNSISVTTNPAKMNYLTGETLDLTGGVLTLNYKGGKASETLNMVTDGAVTEGITFSGFNSATTGAKTVTISYGEKSTTLNVTVALSVTDFTNLLAPLPDFTDRYFDFEIYMEFTAAEKADVQAAFETYRALSATERAKYDNGEKFILFCIEYDGEYFMNSIQPAGEREYTDKADFFTDYIAYMDSALELYEGMADKYADFAGFAEVEKEINDIPEYLENIRYYRDIYAYALDYLDKVDSLTVDYNAVNEDNFEDYKDDVYYVAHDMFQAMLIKNSTSSSQSRALATLGVDTDSLSYLFMAIINFDIGTGAGGFLTRTIGMVQKYNHYYYSNFRAEIDAVISAYEAFEEDIQTKLDAEFGYIYNAFLDMVANFELIGDEATLALIEDIKYFNNNSYILSDEEFEAATTAIETDFALLGAGAQAILSQLFAQYQEEKAYYILDRGTDTFVRDAFTFIYDTLDSENDNEIMTAINAIESAYAALSAQEKDYVEGYYRDFLYCKNDYLYSGADVKAFKDSVFTFLSERYIMTEQEINESAADIEERFAALSPQQQEVARDTYEQFITAFDLYFLEDEYTPFLQIVYSATIQTFEDAVAFYENAEEVIGDYTEIYNGLTKKERSVLKRNGYSAGDYAEMYYEAIGIWLDNYFWSIRLNGMSGGVFTDAFCAAMLLDIEAELGDYLAEHFFYQFIPNFYGIPYADALALAEAVNVNARELAKDLMYFDFSEATLETARQLRDDIDALSSDDKLLITEGSFCIGRYESLLEFIVNNSEQTIA